MTATPNPTGFVIEPKKKDIEAIPMSFELERKTRLELLIRNHILYYFE